VRKFVVAWAGGDLADYSHSPIVEDARRQPMTVRLRATMGRPLRPRAGAKNPQSSGDYRLRHPLECVIWTPHRSGPNPVVGRGSVIQCHGPDARLMEVVPNTLPPEIISPAPNTNTAHTLLLFVGQEKFQPDRTPDEILQLDAMRTINELASTVTSKYGQFMNVLTVVAVPELDSAHKLAHQFAKLKQSPLLPNTTFVFDGRGTLHNTYGVGSEGAIVLLRPDEYIGFFGHLHHSSRFDQYLDKHYVAKSE